MTLLKTVSRRFSKRNAEKQALPEARQHLLSLDNLTKDEKITLSNVSLQLHHADTMYAGDAVHYLKVGLSASRCIREALQRIERKSAVESILDFPSGYGRVLRFVRAMFPDATITAAEVEPTALKFCQRAFLSIPSNQNQISRHFLFLISLTLSGVVLYLPISMNEPLLIFYSSFTVILPSKAYVYSLRMVSAPWNVSATTKMRTVLRRGRSRKYYGRYNQQATDTLITLTR